VAVVATGGTVRIPAGYYPLGGPGLGSVALNRAVTLQGTRAGGKFIDATSLGVPAFRVGAEPVRFADLTILGAVIRHHPVPVAGAINIIGGRVTLDRMTVTGSDTSGSAVSVENVGATLTIRRSLFLSNRSHGYGAAVSSRGRV